MTGIRFPAGAMMGFVFFVTTSKPTLGQPTQSPNQWVPGAFSIGVNRPGHEADFI